MGENELEILQEIGRIGSKSASSALGVLVGKNVDSTAPEVDVISAKRLGTVMKTQEFSGVFLPVKGDMDTMMIVLFSRKNVLLLIDSLSGKRPGTTRFVGEYNQSIIKEVGNILCNADLNAICRTFKVSMIGLVPEVIFNISQSVEGILGPELQSSKVVVIQNSFEIKGVAVEGILLFFLDETKSKKMFGK